MDKRGTVHHLASNSAVFRLHDLRQALYILFPVSKREMASLGSQHWQEVWILTSLNREILSRDPLWARGAQGRSDDSVWVDNITLALPRTTVPNLPVVLWVEAGAKGKCGCTKPTCNQSQFPLLEQGPRQQGQWLHSPRSLSSRVSRCPSLDSKMIPVPTSSGWGSTS